MWSWPFSPEILVSTQGWYSLLETTVPAQPCSTATGPNAVSVVVDASCSLQTVLRQCAKPCASRMPPERPCR